MEESACFSQGGIALDALYFPSLSLPGPAWTYPNLLYFDKIRVIAPDADERVLFDAPTRTLMGCNLVERVKPERYAIDPDSDARVISHLVGLAQKHRRHTECHRLHLGKIEHTNFAQEIVDLGLLWHSSDDWLEGPSWVVDYIMSVLATRMMLHPDLNLSLISDDQTASRLVAGTGHDQRIVANRRLKAVTRLLPIGPDANIDNMVRFRNDHRAELRMFREAVEYLSLHSPIGPDGDLDFDARLTQAERLRNHLVGELQLVRSMAPPITIALSVASIVAPLAETAYFSAAAGALGLGYVIYSLAQGYGRQRTAKSDKLVYAALASHAFSARSYRDVRR